MKAKTPRLTPEAKKLADVLELRLANTVTSLLEIPGKVAVRVAKAKTPAGVKRILGRELNQALRGLEVPAQAKTRP